MPAKLSIAEIRKRFEDHGWILLEHESKGVMATYEAQCPCGSVTRKSPHTFRTSLRCKTCVNREKAYAMRLSIRDVAKEFSKRGIRLLDDDYTNNKTPMTCVCKCGREAQLTYDHVIKGGFCSGCMYERNGRLKMSREQASRALENRGMTLLTTCDIRQKDVVRYICECGREGKSVFANLMKGVRCAQCHIESISGKNSNLYKHGLSEEHRSRHRVDVIASRWSIKVRRRDEFKCQVCGVNKRTIAHHVDSYDAFPDKRTDVSNGVTLCRTCHTDFHRQYGYGNNTKDQFMLFLMRNWGAAE